MPSLLKRVAAPASVLLVLALPAAAHASPAAPGSPTPLVFAAQAQGTVSAVQTVTFAYTGPAYTPLGALEVVGPDADDFWLTGSTCQWGYIPDHVAVPSAPTGCTARVRFLPSAQGARSATLRFSSATDSAVTLQGTGDTAPAASPGQNGADGQAGVNGKDGANGQNGTNGKNGVNAKPTKPGTAPKAAERAKTKVRCQQTARGNGTRIVCRFNRHASRSWLVQLRDQRGALSAAPGNGKTTMVFLVARKPHGAIRAFINRGLPSG